MAKHDMYAESPKISRDEKGDMKVKKMDKEADEGKEKGVKEEGFDEHGQRHAHERMAMHHRHVHEHLQMHHKHEVEHAHHKGDLKSLASRHEEEYSHMHARHEKDMKDMHTRHAKQGTVDTATVNASAKKIDEKGVA